MSWVALVPRDKVHGRARHPVTLSVSKSGRMVQRAFVTVQTDLLPELPWWSNKAAVSVELGTGDHTGRVRLSKGGEYRIMGQTGKGAGHGKANAPTLQFAMDGLPKGGLTQQPVPWEVTGGALILTLPWSDVAGLAKPDEEPKPKPQPAAPAPAPKPVLPPPTPPSAPPPAPKPVPTPAVTSQAAAATPMPPTKPPVSMTYGEIERWAIANNCGSATHGFDLAQVNQKRIRAGQAPFKIRKLGNGG